MTSRNCFCWVVGIVWIAAIVPLVRAGDLPDGSGKVLRKEAIVDAPLEKVWWAWTTPEGIASFFSPASTIELRIGGPYELYMSMKSPDESGLRGSEGCKLLAFEPREMLSFEWNFPPKVMALRKAHAKTHVVLLFDRLPGGKTRVRFAQLGWQEGPDWDAGYAYFDNAWGHVMQQLQTKITRSAEDDAPVESPEEKKSWTDGHVTITSVSGQDKRASFEMTVPVTVERLWQVLATTEGLRSLGGKDAEVQLKPGGKYAFWPGANNRVLSFLPHEMLCVSGSAPPEFPNVRKGGTWGTYFFEKSGKHAAKLRLVTRGWRPGEKEWDGAFDYFLKNNPIFLNQVYAAATASTAAPDRSMLRQEKTIDAPVPEVWQALMTKPGMESWMVAHAEIDLRLGGRMRTQYDPKGVIGDPNTIENIILAYEPQRMYAIKVGKPPEKFPFKTAVKDLWTVVRMEPLGEHQTRVTITGMGYNDSEESQKMRAFFERGNQWTLDKLHEKLSGEATSTAHRPESDKTVKPPG